MFEFVGRAEPAGRRKEARHVVAETPIVGMLLYGHDLQAVVAIFDDARKNLCAEFVVRAYFFCILRHTYMAFVDK